MKNLTIIAQDCTPGPGQGHGIGVGLLNKSYWTLLIDKEGDVYQSKAKFIPGAKIPVNLPPATSKCLPTAIEAWQKDEEKLYLCNEYNMLGINIIPYKKALHVATYHKTDGNGGGDEQSKAIME